MDSSSVTVLAQPSNELALESQDTKTTVSSDDWDERLCLALVGIEEAHASTASLMRISTRESTRSSQRSDQLEEEIVRTRDSVANALFSMNQSLVQAKETMKKFHQNIEDTCSVQADDIEALRSKAALYEIQLSVLQYQKSCDYARIDKLANEVAVLQSSNQDLIVRLQQMDSNLNDLRLLNDHVQEKLAELVLDPHHSCDATLLFVSSESTLASELSRSSSRITSFCQFDTLTVDSIYIPLRSLCRQSWTFLQRGLHILTPLVVSPCVDTKVALRLLHNMFSDYVVLLAMIIHWGISMFYSILVNEDFDEHEYPAWEAFGKR